MCVCVCVCLFVLFYILCADCVSGLILVILARHVCCCCCLFLGGGGEGVRGGGRIPGPRKQRQKRIEFSRYFELTSFPVFRRFNEKTPNCNMHPKHASRIHLQHRFLLPNYLKLPLLYSPSTGARLIIID